MFCFLKSGILLLILIFLNIISLQAQSGCSVTKDVKGYKDFKLCMSVSQVMAMNVCEEYKAPEDVKFIGKIFPISTKNSGFNMSKGLGRGEFVWGEKCYKIMGKRRGIEFYFINNKLSSIGVLLSHSGAGEAGKQLLGEFNLANYVKIQNSLEKKYGLNFDFGKIKTSMFLSDLQNMGRISNIYGDGSVVLSILRYRFQDYEPMDEVSVFYNSKSLAESILATQNEKELKDLLSFKKITDRYN